MSIRQQRVLVEEAWCGFRTTRKIKNAQKNFTLLTMTIELCLRSISIINCIVFFLILHREFILAFEPFELPCGSVHSPIVT
jgi:hypothetical protein